MANELINKALKTAMATLLVATSAHAATKKPDDRPPAAFPPAVVEPEARIDDRIDGNLLSGLVFLIRQSGFICDSVRRAYPFVLGVGIHVTCNKGLYRYEISQPGGQWLVVAK